MNRKTLPSDSSQLSPTTNEARQEVFKILSETLLAASVSLNKEPKQEESAAQPSLPKVSASTIKKSGGATFKSYLSSHTLKGEDVGRGRPPINRVAKSTNVRNKNRKGSQKEKQNNGEGDSLRTEKEVMKDCHLNNVLRSAHRSLFELREAKESLSDIVANDDQLARGVRKLNPTEDHKQLAHVALNITNLCREAFIPAHRLNQTAIALYGAEDFLRYPSDIRTFDLQSPKGRIKLPDVAFNYATVMKLRQVVDFAAETYNKFNGKGRMGEVLQEILFCILRGYQDFYAATLGCQEIFKSLLYLGQKDKAVLQQFLLSLSAMDRSDLLGQIQELRRILDEIVIFLEKLSWGSFVIYRLAGGSAGSENLSSSFSDEQFVKSHTCKAPTYPAYPLLKAKGPKLKQKKGAMDASIEPSGVKFSMTTSPLFSLTDTIKSNVKSGNVMKKSKFSKRRNVNTDAKSKETPVGDANFPDPCKNGDSSSMNYNSSTTNFPRIDVNGNIRSSKMNLEKISKT